MEAWDVADLKSMSAADSNTPSPPMEMDDTPINTDENTNGESKEPCSFSFLAKEAEVDTIAHQITRFMALSEGARLEPSLVYLLQMPEHLQDEMKRLGFDICDQLRALCLEKDIKDASSPEFCQAVHAHLESNPMDTICLTLKAFVMGRTKEEAISKYAEKRESGEWGVHMPWCVQTTGPEYSESLFFIFRTWRDGVYHLRMMLEFGSYPYKGRHHVIVQGVEHCLEGAPCYGLYDWEAYLSGFRGRITEERFRDLKKTVPREIANALIKSGAVDPDAKIRFVEKDKSRAVEEKTKEQDHKNSSHFISSIFALKQHHITAQNAVERVCRLDNTWLPRGSDIPDNKVYDYIPNTVLEDQEATIGFLWLDRKAIPGGANGFTVSLSRNNGSYPPSYPRLVARYFVDSSTVLVYTGMHQEKTHSVFTLSDQEALAILGETLYTIPRNNMAFYNIKTESRKVCLN